MLSSLSEPSRVDDYEEQGERPSYDELVDANERLAAQVQQLTLELSEMKEQASRTHA